MKPSSEHLVKQYAVIHGKVVIRIGHRHFAIPRVTDNAQKIASRSNLRGNWDHIERQPRGSKLIVNQHR